MDVDLANDDQIPSNEFASSIDPSRINDRL